MQDSLGALPTTKWLLPGDDTKSSQQKHQWMQTISRLSGLDLNHAYQSNDLAELTRTIDDAVLTARNRIRNDKRAELLRQHNIYYGFARNLAGLAWYTLALSAFSLIAAGIGGFEGLVPLPVTLIELLFVVIAIGFFFVRDTYVWHCAERYAEFFFTTATTIAASRKESPKKTKEDSMVEVSANNEAATPPSEAPRKE